MKKIIVLSLLILCFASLKPADKKLSYLEVVLNADPCLKHCLRQRERARNYIVFIESEIRKSMIETYELEVAHFDVKNS